MPATKRALRRSREKPGLTSGQTMELLIGPESRSAFRNDDERRAAWWAHRDELMALLPPDGRGWAWVAYEGGGFLPGEGGRVTAALRRIDAKT
jgi:hypothetical protein